MAISALGMAGAETGLNLLSGLIQGGMNYKHSKKLMAYQNQMNVENWKMMNQYNSPGAQMARLREAGLNPNLVYTNGADNTASSVQSAASPSMAGNVDFGSPGTTAVNAYWSAKLNQKQMDMYNAQIDGMKADLDLKHKQSIAQALENVKNSAYLGSHRKLVELSVAQAEADLRSKIMSNRLYGQQEKINNISMTKLAVEIDNLKRTGKSITESVAQRWSEIAISKSLADSNIEVNKETKNKLIQDTANAVRQGNILAFERTIKKFEADVAEGKIELHNRFKQPQNIWQFGNDVASSITYYLRGY